jgi:hypothetical protein
MALQVPNLPGAAAIKMRSVCELAQEVRVKLDGAWPPSHPGVETPGHSWSF